MSDMEALVLNQVRKALEGLEHTGVGHIELEQSDAIFYNIDDRQFKIDILERKITED